MLVKNRIQNIVRHRREWGARTVGIRAVFSQEKGNKFLCSKGSQASWSSKRFLHIVDCLILQQASQRKGLTISKTKISRIVQTTELDGFKASSSQKSYYYLWLITSR